MMTRKGYTTTVTILVTIFLCCDLASSSSKKFRHFRSQHRIRSQHRDRQNRKTELLQRKTDLLRTQPVEVFRELINNRALLERDELDSYSLEALEAIAASINDLDSVQSARKLRKAVNSLVLEETREQQLSAVTLELEERALSESLEKVIQALDENNFSSATGAATDFGDLKSPECLPDPDTIFKKVIEFVDNVQALEVISKLEQATGEAAGPDEQVLELVPETLRTKIFQLNQLNRLIAQSQSVPSNSLSQDEWEKLFENLAGLVEEENLIARFQLEMSIKLFLEGNATLAGKLLPSRLPAQYREEKLQELNSFLTSQGEVRSWPYRYYLQEHPRIPMAVTQLIDEAHQLQWPRDLKLLPPPKEDSQSLMTVARSQLLVRIREQVRELKELNSKIQLRLIADLQAVQEEIQEHQHDQEKRIEEVARMANRELTPLERLVASELDCRGQTPKQILDVLNPLEQEAGQVTDAKMDDIESTAESSAEPELSEE